MEWVYEASDDASEPEVYEADGAVSLDKEAEGDGASGTNGEEEEGRCEYFGDEVEEDEVLAPAEAFARLSKEIANVRKVRAVARQRVVVGESRASRIERVQRELDELAKETGGADDADDGVFNALRAQLAALDGLADSQRVAVVSRAKGETKEDRDDGVTVCVYAASARDVSELERRVAALERAVGPALHVDAAGASVAEVAASVREKLALVDDKAARAALVNDAEKIVGALRPLSDDDAAMKAGNVLARLDEWQHVAASVPAVVARLRSLKRLHDDAARFVAALATLADEQKALRRGCSDNRTLLSTVRDGVEKNVATIKRNVQLLEARLERIAEKAN